MENLPQPARAPENILEALRAGGEPLVPLELLIRLLGVGEGLTVYLHLFQLHGALLNSFNLLFLHRAANVTPTAA